MKLSVILPLVDSRGSAEEAAGAWTRQTLPPHEYEVIAPSPSPAPSIEAQLRSHDRVEIIAGAGEADLYAAGCRLARGEILLLTESHCIPELDTAAELVRYFAESEVAAAHLDGPGISRSALARMEERMNLEYRRNREGVDDWRIASLRGFAVRRDAYDAAGGIDVEVGRLAEKVLAFELLHRGFHIGRAPRAVLHHVNCRRWSQLARPLRQYGQALSTYWMRCEQRGMAPMLAPAAEFRRRAMLSRPVARLTCRLLLASLAGQQGAPAWRTRAGRAARALPGVLAAVLLGGRAALLVARLRVERARVACGVAARHEERLYPIFSRAWQELTRLGVVESMRPGGPAVVVEAAHAVLRPGDMPDGQLPGFHPCEDWGGEPVRWSEPLAIVRLQLPRRRYRVFVDAASLFEPCERRRLRLWFNRHRITCAVPGGERAVLSFVVEPSFFRRGEQHLAFLCDPLPRRHYDRDDPRELGIAVYEIRFAEAC